MVGGRRERPPVGECELTTIPDGVAVVILTFNEEANLAHALESVTGWADETFVLDSMSTDATLEIARRYGACVREHKFENYAAQRNYALDQLPIQSEWILFLDADEWLPETAKAEISRVIGGKPIENGFYMPYRLMWMGKWIRRGYYPSWILRLFRAGKARCDDRAINEHMIVEGPTARLNVDLIHEDRKGISAWIAKHNNYASGEALELLRARKAPGYREIDAKLFGSQAQRKRWVRQAIWNRLPPLIRPFLYFVYRYVLRLGFLDGPAAFVFHFLHGLWYPMLIDIKYLEMRRVGAETVRPSAATARLSRVLTDPRHEESH